MKARIKNLLLLSKLVAGLALIPANRMTAQIVTTLRNFSGGGDGKGPLSELISSGNTLYGTTVEGGSSGNGIVFAMNRDGTGFTNLHSFAALSASSEFGGTNGEGANPTGRLVLSDTVFYGTASFGGSLDYGTVFAVKTDGTGFTNLHSFTGVTDGSQPYPGLILSGDTLYGITTSGGSSGNGTVYAVQTDGTSFKTLQAFSSLSAATNNDGANPAAELILSDNTLFGTARYGGNSNGTVFAVNTDGTGFTTLHSFAATSGSSATNNDGSTPASRLILSGNVLYGTAAFGGSSGSGTVFAVKTDGTDFKILHSFRPATSGNSYVNSDGYYVAPGLVLSGNTLYGSALWGGSSGNGTLYSINTDGTDFATLYSFPPLSHPPLPPPFEEGTNATGADPQTLFLSGTALFGTAALGGNSGNGTIFGLTLPAAPPQLAIVLSGTNAILSWTNTAVGFTLHSTTNLSPAAWTTNLPIPVVINGQYIVSVPISGTQQFFELSQ